MAVRVHRHRITVFLQGLLLAVLLLLHQGARAAVTPPKPAEIRGVWITANDMGVLRDRERMRTTTAQLADLQFNTLYPVVWNGGHAYYPSQVSEQRGLQSFTYRGLQGQDILAELVAAAHGRGLLVIPWFEFGLMVPVDADLARQHPDWLTRQRDGRLTSMGVAGDVAWLNPFRPEVQQLITELVLEIVSQYDVDGIQFDDHMSLPREFGYDPFTMALYRKQTGKTAPADPQDGAWVKWRADRLSDFMETLHRAIKASKPGVVVSVAPNYYDFAYKLQLQDWLAWVRRGSVDEVVVQLYRPDVDSFQAQLSRPEFQQIKGKVATAIGILTGQRRNPVPLPLIQGQVQAARAQGHGLVFFYLESLWALGTEPQEERQAALRQMFADPAPRAPQPRP